MEKTEKNLLTDKRYFPFFWTQALGAFNDNVFKTAFVFLITFRSYTILNIEPEQMVAMSLGIFILPFFLFSSLAGELCDKYSKSTIIFQVKIWEVIVMGLGLLGFYLENAGILTGTLFLMGMQSAFFGPVKYSILPQLLEQDELTQGTAWVESGTFISILFGTILGGQLAGKLGHIPFAVGLICVFVAMIGAVVSKKILKLKSEAPSLKININIVKGTWNLMKVCTKQESVFNSVMGISWFWFLGALILQILPIYTKDTLSGNEDVGTFFMALFSVGIALGSFLCEKFSNRKLELGLVPIGTIGVTVFLAELFFAPVPVMPGGESVLNLSDLVSSFEGIRISMDFLLFSVFSGFFIVPLYTLIQERPEESERSRVIAGNNVINALFMVVGSAFLAFLLKNKVSMKQIFLILALMNLAVGIYIYTVIPEFLFRFICWILSHLFYRLDVKNQENIPEAGPAVLVCNHVSFVDWMIISSASPRPIRFVMHADFLAIPLSGRIFRDAKVIPIAGKNENPEILEQAFLRIDEELAAGEVVCIFPEGALTSDGEIAEFRKGIERIIEKRPVDVIPMALSGLWGSYFSRISRKDRKSVFGGFMQRITLSIAPRIAAHEVDAPLLQRRVTELRSSP